MKESICPNCGKKSPAKDIEYLGDQKYECKKCRLIGGRYKRTTGKDGKGYLIIKK